ncbi:type IX secretion system sortase PorU [bacterium SCSIO 12741]|nr:type IX secretion system sortase PorU [bacterium SCSIO 12741]
MFHSFAQERVNLQWTGIQMDRSLDGLPVDYLNFVGAAYQLPDDFTPRYTKRIAVPQNTTALNVIISDLELSPLSAAEQKTLNLNLLSEIPQPSYRIYEDRGRKFASISFIPLLKSGSTVRRIDGFVLTVETQQGFNSATRSTRSDWKETSVLVSGDWYKIQITKTGVYKIDYDFLKGMGISPESVNFGGMRIFGNGGGRLLEPNTAERQDDLKENPIELFGAEDGRFDKGDFALFYAEHAHRWNEQNGEYFFEVNPYSDTNFYFLTFNGGDGTPARIQKETAQSNPVKTITEFNDYAVHELEQSNLIGSGRVWYGESFNVKTTYFIEFDFPYIVTSSEAKLDSYFAIRSVNSNSTMSINASGLGSSSVTGGNVAGTYTAPYARDLYNRIKGNPSSSKIGVTLNFSKANGEANAWLNRLQVNCRRQLRYVGSQMNFRSFDAYMEVVNYANVRYSVSNANSNLRVWKVSEPRAAVEVNASFSGSNLEFVTKGDTTLPSEFVVFSPFDVPTPDGGYSIENQNLHGVAVTFPEMVILSHPSFLSYAEKVAEHHTQFDGLTVYVTTPDKVYNEFSSGRQDITAIKDFMRMFYERAATPDDLPKYLLLFGDASYDYKDRVTGNTNFVPIYQTTESLRPTGSLASDDYVSFLSPDYDGRLDSGVAQIGVGRFPVKDLRQASNAVTKLLRYTSESSFGPWRNSAVYVGDDEDRNEHMDKSNKLADTTDFLYPDYNVSKVFLDAYPQRSTPGGQRYPDVNIAIDDAVQRGSLTINYLGHGGELGWAHERVLEVSQINKWRNPTNMPLFVTATCEFSRFDDPRRTSAGEFVFLNPDGAGIGLLTTTRLVYSSPNYALASAFNRLAYGEIDGETPRLGDILRLTKTHPRNFNGNTRVFALLGDPAMKLAYPREKVVTTARPDTIGSLQKVTIEGEVQNRKTGELLTGFNGVVFPTIYDKKRTIETLNNDGKGAFTFDARINVLFRGKVTVTNGKFSFTFVVPKDINFNFGQGKISYYAHNNVYDAAGFDTTLVVGGQSGDASSDQVGPQVDLYMNDSTFVFGGMTNESPSIYARLYDDNGINTSGGGVGHDIVAVLDENTANEIVLNEYYEAELNSYQKGVVNYPLKDLSDGKHTLRLKAWDVYNNSGTANTEFVVSESAELALDHVLNYPNPFTTNTEFYLEHNYPSQDLFVRIQIFTVSGKIVKTLDGYFNSKGFRIGPIKWDGLDDFGDKIGVGVYVYKVEVKAPNGELAEKFEKLVILN